MGVNFCCNKNISIDNSKSSLQINQPFTNLQNNEKNKTSSNSNANQNKKNISFSPNITDKQSHQITASDDINLSLNNLNKNSSIFFKTKTINSTKKLKNNNSINENNHKIRNKIKSKSLGRRSVYLTRTYINILILGDKNTGKTSYINLLQKKQFNDEYKPSIDIEIHVEKILVNKRKFNFNIIIINNINENEDFHTNKDYYLFFYDINNMNSLNFIINLYNNFFYEKLIKINEHFSNILFIGNKLDLKQNDDVFNTVKNFCKEKHINHYEISIKENKGIEELDKLLVNNFDSNFSDNNITQK